MDPYSAIFMRQVDLPIYYKHVKAYEATVTIYLFIIFFFDMLKPAIYDGLGLSGAPKPKHLMIISPIKSRS